MKRTIVALGLIASTGSIFFLPNKTMAESGPSERKLTSMAIGHSISGHHTGQANYTATDEDGNPENVETGETQTTSE